MNLGKPGDESTLVFKRKYRWTLSGDFPSGKIPEAFVGVSSRPNLKIVEEEKNYLGNKTWIPGKHEWESITTTHFEVDEKNSKELFTVLGSFWDFEKQEEYKPSEDPSKLGTVYIRLYDGCGTLMETWELLQTYPKSINFGDLDHSSSNEVIIEITWAYKEVKYKFEGPTWTAKEEDE